MPNTINRDQISLLLKKVNHPGRYVGTEVNSANKSFQNATVRTVLAFPDLYEIGISNLGLKILYNAINSQPNFMADRTYAPDKDFREVLIDNKVELYAVESFVALKSFDVVAFSIQYELNYTTMLGMLEMSNIPIYSKDRLDTDPLVIAGGPSCFNPEPFADFVDAVVISDGEEVLIELLNAIEKLKKGNITSRKEILLHLCQLRGVYVPSLYSASTERTTPLPLEKDVPASIKKNFSELTSELHPEKFPIPNISCVHDRSVVEIRRGCARMCRFCQPGYVNLPVRERGHEEVKDLCFKSLELSGYDELSLLSLSTSDYTGLEHLALELNSRLASQEVSISLPSQRADSFNLELARQLQAVRKSILTFAPEAGTERLRNVINKNLTEDQIIKTAITAYGAGWNKIKLYFIIGLPTETYEDLDGIINLIQKIKDEANLLRHREPKNKRPLDIICTIATFIPKPFTPFQWFGQLSTDEIRARRKYLVDAARNIKGLKLNFHDTFCAKLESLFSRGSRDLGQLIFNAYNKGAYLDSWNEYFSYNTWKDTAIESGFDIEKLTTTEFDTNDSLPWEMIDTGMNKEWLINQKQLAMENKKAIPCEDACTNCGVCVNLNVNPKYKSREKIEKELTQSQTLKDYSQRFKYRIKLTKEGNLRFVSHLDWFRLIYRATKRIHLPVAFSQGFNPAPKISIGNPLGLFTESISEFMDIELFEKVDSDTIKASLNNILPDVTQVIEAYLVDNKIDSIDKLAHWSVYEIIEEAKALSNLNFDDLEQKITTLMSEETLIISKKTKSKIKQLDIKPLIKSVEILKDKPEKIMLTISCAQGAMVKPYEFLNLISNPEYFRVKRIKILDKDLKSL